MKNLIGIICLLIVQYLPAQVELSEIEQTIFSAYGKSFQMQSDQIAGLITQLAAIEKAEEKKTANYWIAFAEYRSAVFHMVVDQEKKSVELLDSAEQRLKAVKEPTSEDLALLGSVISLSINFKPDLAPILSSKANDLFVKALKLNDQNLRAHLGIGRSDYYKPVEYGGGNKVENALKTALAMPDQSFDAAHAPAWGKDEAYYYLASYYLREDRLEDAKFYCFKGVKAYPYHGQLQSLKAKIQ